MMTREVFARSWAKVPATPNDTERNNEAMKMCSQFRPRGIARQRPCAISRINSVAAPMLQPIRRMPHGETSSSAMRIAVQLKPQQKLSATSRSLAIVALLMADLEATGHPAGEGMDRKAGCFTARAAPGAILMHMTVMQ